MFNEYANNRDFGRNSFESDRNYGLAKSDQDFNHMNTNRYYDLDVNKNNFDQMDRNRNFGLDQAGVTGYYNGQRTEAGRQNDIGNSQWNQQFKRSNFESDRSFNRGVLESDRSWNQMSPADRQRMMLEFANSMKLKKADGGGPGGNPYANPYFVNQPPTLDLNNVNNNDLLAYYQSILQGQSGNPTIPYGTQAYIDKMKKLQY
jgi:hypothetical protein